MKKIFLDTSVYNRALIENVSPKNLQLILKKWEGIPIIGSHVLYEMEKGFLYSKHKQNAISLLNYCLELQPALITTTSDLLDQEIARARYGSAVLPMMIDKLSKSTWEGITDLKNNPEGHPATFFVNDRESRRKKDESIKSPAYINYIKDIKSRVPHEPMTIESFLKLPIFPDDIAQALEGQHGLNSFVINRIASDLNKLPAIRTLIRANLYRSWIFIENEIPPAPDKIDDGRHIIDASYSDHFVTADNGQIKLASILNPELSIMSWQDLKN